MKKYVLFLFLIILSQCQEKLLKENSEDLFIGKLVDRINKNCPIYFDNNKFRLDSCSIYKNKIRMIYTANTLNKIYLRKNEQGIRDNVKGTIYTSIFNNKKTISYIFKNKNNKTIYRFEITPEEYFNKNRNK